MDQQLSNVEALQKLLEPFKAVTLVITQRMQSLTLAAHQQPELETHFTIVADDHRVELSNIKFLANVFVLLVDCGFVPVASMIGNQMVFIRPSTLFNMPDDFAVQYAQTKTISRDN